MKKVAVVYMAHDGFTSLYTGVGTIAQDFLLSFPEVSRNLEKKFKDYIFDCYVTTIKYDKNCFGFSKELKNKTLAFINKNKHIHLIELVNDSCANESYATIEHWKAASISGATFIYLLSSKYDEIIVIAVDTPFAQVANYYFKQYDNDNVKIIWLPQSTVLIHREMENSLSKEEKKRYLWEKETVNLAAKHKNVFIGYVGAYMKKHLIGSYNAKASHLVSLSNGLYFKRLKKNISSQKTIKHLLLSLKIPVDRPLLFSFGRAEYYKGLDLTIVNSSELTKTHNFFTLILASPYDDNKNDPTVKKLKEFEARNKKDIKVIPTQDFSLPHRIIQWHKTHILAILSRAEPFGLIPIESRFYKNKNLVLVVSNIGGLNEQVENGKDGFVTTLHSKSIKKYLKNAAELSSKKRTIISYNGYRKVISYYNQVKINTDFISQMLLQ